MTALVIPFTADADEVVTLRSRGLGATLELGVTGDLGGGALTVSRRYLANDGTQIGADVPVVYSWKDQSQVQITAPVGGLAIENIIAEGALVFSLVGATDPDFSVILLGIA